MNHRLWGYDCRSRDGFYSSPVADRRRANLHLVRPDADAALSIDRMVWPSPLGNITIREEFENINGMFASLEQAVKATRLAKLVFGHFQIICATVLFDSEHVNQFGPSHHDETIAHAELQDWQLLGYDVADEGMISALMNCGLGKELRAKYSSRIQKTNHLFSTVTSAKEFCKDANRLVSEHAPFAVFALYDCESRLRPNDP